MAEKKKPKLLELAKSRVSISRRFHKRWRDDVKKWIKDYNIQTIDDVEFQNLSNKLQIPYIFSTVESGLPVMFERVPEIIMVQRGKADKDFTDWANSIWDFLKEKLKLEEKIEEAGYLFKVAGQASMKYGWKMETETIQEEKEVPITDEQGNVVEMQTVVENVEVPVKDEPYIETLSYKRVHYSPESLFVLDDDENKIPYIICEHVRTPEEMEELYGKKPSGKSSSLNLTEIDDELKSDQDIRDLDDEDIKRITEYQYYGTLPKEQFEDKDSWRSDAVYYMVFTNDEIIKEPERIKKKPVLQVGNYGLPTQFHKFGDPRVIRALELDISLGRSRMADYRDKFGTKIILPPTVGDIDEVALRNPADRTILRMTGTSFPQYLAPPPLPETLIALSELSKSDLQMASAQLDLSRGSTQSVVDTATGQKIFQEATEKRIARQRKKMGRLIKAIAKNVLMLCAENWDVDYYSQITDTDPTELEQMGYIEKLKNLGNEFDVDVEVEDVVSNKETLRAQAIALYREVREDPMVPIQLKMDILKEALKIGFSKKNVDQYFPPGMVEQMAAQQAGMMPGAMPGQEGRPPVVDPTQVVQNAQPAADATQVTAQNDASYKQTGVPKGPQQT